MPRASWPQSGRIAIIDLVNEMKNQHVHFKTMTDSIDTKTPVGRFFFHVMASLAMEQELIVERTRAVAGSRDWTLRVVGLAERKGDYHPSPARVVSSVVPSLRTGERILPEASQAECISCGSSK